MKIKVITLVLFLFAIVQNSQAQYFENGSTGFEIDYLGEGDEYTKCLKAISSGGGQGGFASFGGNVSSVSLFDDPDYPLTIRAKPLAEREPLDANPAYMNLFFTVYDEGEFEGRCFLMNTYPPSASSDFTYMDLSGSNSKVIVYAKSDVPTTLNFYLAYWEFYTQSASSFDDGIVKTISLTTEMTAYELDFSDWAKRDRVNMYGFSIVEPDVTVSIGKISFGSSSSVYPNRIKGNVYDDLNNDCAKQTGEEGLSSIMVKATDGNKTYLGYTDKEGNYSIAVDSGAVTYAVSPVWNEKLSKKLSITCVPARLLETSGSGKVFCCSDFAVKVTHCSALSVQVNGERKRRCFPSTTSISYANEGKATAESAVVKVVYPEFVLPLSSVPPWTSKIGDTLIYQVGNLTAGSRGQISLIDSVICGREDIRGRSQCLQAIISPKSQCESDQDLWDGSSITVYPYCENGVARFVVQNIGREDMTGSSAYRLYSNDTLIFQSTFQLISGNTFQVRYPANGAVIHLEADQRPFHPGRSQPRAFVEGCGTFVVQPSVATRESLVLSIPQDDLEEEVSISCVTIVDSFDPNDKAAAPVGKTDNHLVQAGERLQYTIRFQNTGTDIAYNVKVVDTLDVHLEESTFTEASSSHAYTLKLSSDEQGEKTILTYLFDNINLKDSTTSERESHGFVSFYINSKEDLADGNTIRNKAEIFFDYNSAIVTNVVDHTIGTYVPTDFTKGNSVQVTTGLFDGNAKSVVQRVLLYPNPASDVIQVKLDQKLYGGQLIILDLSGHEVWSDALKGEVTSVSISSLSSGMYMYKVMSNGEYLGVGKLLVK